MAHVVVLVGSRSDLPSLKASSLPRLLSEEGIEFKISICSAHRNLFKLIEYVQDETEAGAGAFVAAAGWAAALPGAVRAILLEQAALPIYGIALSSEGYPKAEDAEISIKRLPPGVEVDYEGVDVEGYDAAAADIIGSARLGQLLPASELSPPPPNTRQPEFNIDLEEIWTRPVILNQGKTKIIEQDTDDPNCVLVRSKNDITAGDGAKHDLMEGKAASSTKTTCNIFELLEHKGVATHFVERVDPVTFRARNVDMIPLELIARRIATGSYLNRFPDTVDGTRFDELVFEVFEKDDPNHDPLLEFDFESGILRRYVPNKTAAEAIGGETKAGDLIGEEPLAASKYADVIPEVLDELKGLTLTAFAIIEEAFGTFGGTYFDYKIECGRDRETGKLLVADVIDSDSGRLRFGDRDVSKQAYRDGSQSLPDIKKNFDEVADLTDQFAAL